METMEVSDERWRRRQGAKRGEKRWSKAQEEEEKNNRFVTRRG